MKNILGSGGGRALALISLGAVLILAACDGGGDSIGVELTEFAITPSPASAGEGEVTFELENVGAEPHEFVVIQTDLAPEDLPTVEDGSVDEEGEGMTVVDEVEDLPSGESEELAVDLDAGSYALICNIVEEEDGESESHYQEGMSAAFSVE